MLHAQFFCEGTCNDCLLYKTEHVGEGFSWYPESEIAMSSHQGADLILKWPIAWGPMIPPVWIAAVGHAHTIDFFPFQSWRAHKQQESRCQLCLRIWSPSRATVTAAATVIACLSCDANQVWEASTSIFIHETHLHGALVGVGCRVAFPGVSWVAIGDR